MRGYGGYANLRYPLLQKAWQGKSSIAIATATVADTDEETRVTAPPSSEPPAADKRLSPFWATKRNTSVLAQRADGLLGSGSAQGHWQVGLRATLES